MMGGEEFESEHSVKRRERIVRPALCTLHTIRALRTRSPACPKDGFHEASHLAAGILSGRRRTDSLAGGRPESEVPPGKAPQRVEATRAGADLRKAFAPHAD